MPTFQDIITKSIFVFLLCQHVVNAASEWSSISKQFGKRLEEDLVPLLQSSADDEVQSMGRMLEKKLKEIETLNTTLGEKGAIFEDLMNLKEHWLNNLTAMEEEIQRIANELPLKVEERKAVERQLEPAVVGWLEAYEDAIRSHFLGGAHKELEEHDEDNDEFCQHAVISTNEGASQAKHNEKMKAELKTLQVPWKQKFEELLTMRETLDDEVEELMTMNTLLREKEAEMKREDDLMNQKEHILNDLTAKEEKIRTITRKREQKRREWSMASRQMFAVAAHNGQRLTHKELYRLEKKERCLMRDFTDIKAQQAKEEAELTKLKSTLREKVSEINNLSAKEEKIQTITKRRNQKYKEWHTAYQKFGAGHSQRLSLEELNALEQEESRLWRELTDIRAQQTKEEAELSKLTSTLREKMAESKTSREAELVNQKEHIVNGLSAKEEKIQTVSKQLLQKSNECKTSLRQSVDADCSKLLRRAQKKLDEVLKASRKLRENDAEMELEAKKETKPTLSSSHGISAQA